MCSKGSSWNPRKCICENGKYLKSIVDESVIMCNEIINTTNYIPKNATSSVSINSDDKNVGHKMLYSAHRFISDHIAIYNRYYLLSSSLPY